MVGGPNIAQQVAIVHGSPAHNRNQVAPVQNYDLLIYGAAREIVRSFAFGGHRTAA
jgi:hypothetical protein